MMAEYQAPTKPFESKFITFYSKILVSISKKQPLSISDVQRDTGVTYTHLQKCVKLMVKLGLLKRKTKGRIVELSTTDVGESLAQNMGKIISALDGLGKKQNPSG